MLKTQAPTAGLLFSGFLFDSFVVSQDEMISIWEDLYGPSFYFIPAFNPFKNYYAAEMGEEKNLRRFFLLSSKTFERDILLPAKLKSLELEFTWSQSGKRKVNIDPGLLTLENFTLATTKNYSHRTYLGQNIFTDLTYQFQHGKFETLPWTYPDYVDDEKIQFFTWARSYLHTLLSRANQSHLSI